MPPLRHYPQKDSGEAFRFEDSEVLQWLFTETRFLERLMESLRESGAITYDADTETWRGHQVEKPCSKLVSEACSKPFFLNTVLCSKYPLYINIKGGMICEHERTPNPLATTGADLSTSQVQAGGEQ